MILSVFIFYKFVYFNTGELRYQSETMQVNLKQLDIITEERDRGTITI